MFYIVFFVVLTSYANAQTCYPSCINSGVCGYVNSVATCQCTAYFTGSYCQLANPCVQSPCSINGVCSPKIIVSSTGVESASYTCQCYPGFTGNRCQYISTTPCDSRPCLNNGNCSTISSTSYQCNCIGSYTGPNCGTYVDYCLNNNCKNNGQCIPDAIAQSYTCQCQTGYFGLLCENKLSYCAVPDANNKPSNPCKNNGTCIELTNGYTCLCAVGYTGTTCETLYGGCDSNPCKAGSTCVPDNSGGYTCKCNSGFFGSLCLPDPCISSPCRKADSTCIPIEQSADPACPASNYACQCANTSPTYASVNC